jgi:ATP-dependent DNA helicase RecG
MRNLERRWRKDRIRDYGFFLYDVYAYNERAVREAVLNAVCHRNYQLPGSVFVRQYNDRIEFESPGGFPSGITVDNILDRQSARNRRLAEIVARCGLVERSGQGMNLIFEESIKEAKELPDFTGTDAHFVRLRLGALITDPALIRIFKEIGEKTLSSFSTDDFRVVRYVVDGKPIPRILRSRIERLVSHGVLERVGRSKVLVSRQYYKAIGKSGTFTRLKGLDNGTNKELLMRHMKDMDNPGLKLSDFQLVLPSLGVRQIQWLLKDLEATSRVYVLGRTRAARWFLGRKPPELTSGLTSELTSIDKSDVIKDGE